MKTETTQGLKKIPMSEYPLNAFFEMDHEDYHAFTSRFSRSNLWMIHEYDEGYYQEWLRDGGDEVTEEMRKGTASHHGVFEPEVFKRTYRSYGKSRNLNHEDYRNFLVDEGVKHENVFTEAGMLEVYKVVESALASPAIQELKSSGVPEAVVYWDDPQTGVPCKAKLDWADPDNYRLGEYKTISSVYGGTIEKQCANKGYWLQAVHNLDGFCMATIGKVVDWDDPEFELPLYPFIFTGKDRNRKTVARYWEREQLQGAAAVRASLLKRVAKCLETNIWPGVGDQLEPIHLPKWGIPNVA